MLSLLAGATQAQVINEFMAINDSQVFDSQNSQFSDWIELYNPTNQALDLTGYFLSDNPEKPAKWAFPAGTQIQAFTHLLIWADGLDAGLHTNFKLQGGFGEIMLTNGSGIVDEISYGLQIADQSFGRQGDGQATWAFFANPSAGTTNATNGTQRLDRVQFSQAGGMYNNTQYITLSHSDNQAQIYYTLDGSPPNQNDELYNGAIEIDENTPVRAIAIRPGYHSSIVSTNTYLIDESSSLPVVMLATDPDGFFSDETGMYVEGTNGVEDFCSDGPANWNMDWERAVNFEYYVDGSQAISMQLGASIFGGCSRVNAMKSLALKARNEYEGKTIPYAFFQEKPEIDEFQSILLRNSGNDFNQTMFRDALMQRLIQDHMDLEHQAYQPTITFINGEYWGIHNLRERISSKFIEENADVDGDNIDLLERDGEDVREGDTIHYMAMMDFLRTNDMTTQANYDYIKIQMDVENYADYMLAEIYFRNTDWPGNNIRFWRPRTSDGKWRWILYDTDFGYGLWGEGPDHNTLEFALEADGPDWPNPEWSTELFRTLMTNDEFRELFIDRMMSHLSLTFEPSRANWLIDEMANGISAEIDRHMDRWGGWAPYWSGRVDEMKDFANDRPGYMMDFLADEYGFSDTEEISAMAETGATYLRVNGVPASRSGYTGEYFVEQTVKLSTEVMEGYRFTGWRLEAGAGQTISLLDAESTWKYSDEGTDQDGFEAINFDDSQWSSGQARLGYGGDGEITELSYGPDPDNKHATYYFRKSFEVNDPSEIDELQIGITVDDAAIVYLNGVEVYRNNLPEGEIAYTDFAIDYMSDLDEITFNEFIAAKGLLNEGTNVIAVEVHQSSGTSSDMGFDLYVQATTGSKGALLSNELTYAAPVTQGLDVRATFELIPLQSTLYINEFVADNENGLTDPSGKFEDWVEIYNGGNSSVDIGGLYISETSGHLGMWQIPNTQPDSTTIPPGGHLVLFADNDTEEGVLHLPFKLSANGEQIVLSQWFNGDTTILDQITFGPQIPDASYGRYPDGEDNWIQMTEVTPGATNQIPADPITGIFINEFLTGNDFTIADNHGEYDDWIELYNSNDVAVDIGGLYLSDTLGQILQWKIPTTQPDSTTIPAKGFLVLWADKDPEQGVLHLDFSLGDKNEDIVLSQLIGGQAQIIDQYSYGNQWRDVSSGRYADGANNWEQFNHYTPGASNERDPSVVGKLVINEVLANSTGTVMDEYGEYDDYIEIFNKSDEAIDIGGLWLTDTTSTKSKYRIPSNNPDSTTIPAGEFLVLWADGSPEQGVLHLDFRLSATGEELALVQIIATDTTFIDELIFDTAIEDVSVGRFPDGNINQVSMGSLTPGGANIEDLLTTDFDGSIGFGMKVYPNPALDVLNISSNDPLQIHSLALINSLGQQVMRMDVNGYLAIDVRSLPAGIYVLQDLGSGGRMKVSLR